MVKHLPFKALRSFEAAARHLSFRYAAEELHITASAVSQQVRSLEDRLGVKLFHRLNRSLALTQAAQLALPKLREGFDMLAEAVGQIEAPTYATTLNVWMAPSFASNWLVPRLPRFTEVYPDIDLTISASTDLIDRGQPAIAIPDSTLPSGSISAEKFRCHNVNLAIRFGQGHYPGCRVDKLFSVSATPMCSPSLLAGEHPLRRPEDLRHHALLHDATVYEGRPDWASWLKAAGVDSVDATHGMRFNRVALALAAAADGQGVVLSLPLLAAADLDAGRLVVPFELSLPLDYAYYVISLDQPREPPEIGKFRRWLLAEAGRSTDEQP